MNNFYYAFNPRKTVNMKEGTVAEKTRFYFARLSKEEQLILKMTSKQVPIEDISRICKMRLEKVQQLKFRAKRKLISWIKNGRSDDQFSNPF